MLSLFRTDAKRLVIRLSIAILKRRYGKLRAAGRERHTPTSQLDWFISTTAMILVSWSKAKRHRFKSFWLVLHQSAAANISLPPTRQHLASGGTTTRTKNAKVQNSAIRSARKRAGLRPAARDCLVLRSVAWTFIASER